MKTCLMCGDTLVGKREDSKFCSSSCKAKHWEMSKGKNLKGVEETTLLNPIVIPTTAPIKIKVEAKTETKITLPALTPFRNLVGEIPQEKHNAAINSKANEYTALGELPLPAQYTTKIVQIPTFAFTVYQKKLSDCQKDMLTLETEIKRLTNLIEAEKAKNGTGIYVAGAGSGALIGYNLKSAPKGKEPDNRLLLGLLGGILGIGLGRLIDEATVESHEKSKRENIAKMEKQKAEYQNRLQFLQAKEKQISIEKAKTTPFEQKEIKMLNPAYALIVKHNEEYKASVKNSLSGLNGVKQGFSKNDNEKEDFESDKITSMQHLAGMKFSLLNFDGKWRAFFGQPQTNFFCCIHGMSGEGKSHFAMQFSKYLAERFGNVLFVSGEEGFAPTFQQKVKLLGADIKNLYAGNIRTGKELVQEVPNNKFHFIVIDSLNNMGIDPEMMRQIRKKFKDSAIIAICQNTKDGKVRGSYEIMHDSDIIVKVADGMAVTIKNRFKEKNMTFDVFEVLRKKDNKVISINRKSESGNSEMDSDLRNTI